MHLLYCVDAMAISLPDGWRRATCMHWNVKGTRANQR
jgi:hypothetical protein